MNATNKLATLSWSLVLLLALLLPFFCNYDKYILHTGISIAFNIALATSMWLIWTLGFVSFAHAGFMGIGAYTSAILFTRLGWPLWVNMWLAAGLAAMIALVISIPLMRTRAVYFFMASWAIGEVIKRIFAYYREFFGRHGIYFKIIPMLDGGGAFKGKSYPESYTKEELDVIERDWHAEYYPLKNIEKNEE